MPTADGNVFRVSAANIHVHVATVDAVLGFTGTRAARTVTHALPAGGNHFTVRPHAPRTGTFEFLFVGTSAQSRAKALEDSLATGGLHYLSGTTGGTSVWQWRTTGQITFERVHDARGAAWKVSADWTEMA